MELPKRYFRHMLLLYFNQKKTVAEEFLQNSQVETYGNVAPSIKT